MEPISWAEKFNVTAATGKSWYQGRRPLETVVETQPWQGRTEGPVAVASETTLDGVLGGSTTVEPCAYT
jgi:hypothetical protein